MGIDLPKANPGAFGKIIISFVILAKYLRATRHTYLIVILHHHHHLQRESHALPFMNC
jgi:hypothetical protein